jgi:phosphohistidine phosphatase
MWLYLVHHGEALASEIDARRPLSDLGRQAAQQLAEQAAARGVKPVVIWHSGKLRARQTAEAFWRACNPLAEFTAVRGLQPGDIPQMLRDTMLGETRDVMVVGHMPHLSRALSMLTTGVDLDAPFPINGLVALDGGPTAKTDARAFWTEGWRLTSPASPQSDGELRELAPRTAEKFLPRI